MTLFTWSKYDTDYIVPVDNYIEEFKNWKLIMRNGQFHLHTLKDKKRKEATCNTYSGSAKFNGIHRELKK